MRTIRVTGKGQMRVRPDMMRVTMALSGLCPDYGDALRRSAEETEELKALLSGFGFERADLKTLSFDVDTEYESYRDENNNYRQRFAGYRFNHLMKLEFPSDNERLGRILRALSVSAASPELRLSYTVSDPEATKNLLLGRAVTDAKEKAAVLTKAGGVRLLDVQSIDYSWGEIDIACRPMDGMVLSKSCISEPEACCDLDVEPDDIEVSDTVTVVWEIA